MIKWRAYTSQVKKQQISDFVGFKGAESNKIFKESKFKKCLFKGIWCCEEFSHNLVSWGKKELNVNLKTIVRLQN